MDYSGLQVVIVNWQKPEDTLECLSSLQVNGLLLQQILVVDNGSQDDSVVKIRSAYPALKVYSLPQNQGFAGGYNYGIGQALASGAEQIFILNNDTVVDEQTIPVLLRSDWDIAVPKIFFHNQPNQIWSAGAQWRRFPPMVTMRGYQQPNSSQFDHPMALDYATACALMVRRRVFEQIKGFDPLFENYHEDYDFAYRARKAGFRIGYVPDARVWHKVSRSLGQASPQRWWYLGRNSVLFYRKDGRFPAWMLAMFLIWFSLRETLKLNMRRLPDFWTGVRAGLELIRHGTSKM